MKIRTKVYTAIVERLADRGWHETRELEELTLHPEPWLEELEHDPKIEVDRAGGKMRLRPC